MVQMRTVACLAAISGAIFLGACTAPPVVVAGLSVAQAGTAAYINGALQTAYMSRLDEAYSATIHALETLEITVNEVRRDEPDEIYIIARRGSGPEVRITLWAFSDNLVKIRIRVGVLGDQAVSRVISSRIDARIPDPPAEVIPEPLELPPVRPLDPDVRERENLGEWPW